MKGITTDVIKVRPGYVRKREFRASRIFNCTKTRMWPESTPRIGCNKLYLLEPPDYANALSQPVRLAPKCTWEICINNKMIPKYDLNLTENIWL